METDETKSWVGRLSRDEAQDCLGTLRGLASQLDSAMDAMVQRKLPLLRNSLHLQQASCARLMDLRHRSQRGPAPIADAESAFSDSDLAAEIEAAARSLLILNDRYAALLKHSGETLRLLAGLYRSYRGPAPLASGAQANLEANLQTWSCEV
jgi:hypothetical protein